VRSSARGKATQNRKAQLAFPRFSLRDGLCFNVVQPYQHHETFRQLASTSAFALKPEDHQPSDRATCRVLTTPRCAQLEKMATGSQVSVYATNYNVLHVGHGRFGLRLRLQL
jgi:hypothetical protein